MANVKRKTKIRHQRFAKAYIQNGCNGKQAYLSISPNVTPHVAEVQASEYLRKPEVLKTIEFELNDLNEKYLQGRMLEKSLNSVRDSDQIRALENLCKIKGMLRDTNININNANGISADDIARIRSASTHYTALEPQGEAIAPPADTLPTPIADGSQASNDSASL